MSSIPIPRARYIGKSNTFYNNIHTGMLKLVIPVYWRSRLDYRRLTRVVIQQLRITYVLTKSASVHRKKIPVTTWWLYMSAYVSDLDQISIPRSRLSHPSNGIDSEYQRARNEANICVIDKPRRSWLCSWNQQRSSLVESTRQFCG